MSLLWESHDFRSLVQANNNGKRLADKPMREL